MAHFLEHMLFNGTEEFPENELVATLRSFGASFGADVNAYTSYDETVYELTMPTQDPTVVATGLRILEQWLAAATLDPAQVEAERGVVLDEWRGSATSSSGRIFDELESLLLDGSPYEGRDPIGTDDGDQRDDPRAAAGASTTTWYRPDNASVVVVGDIDTADDRWRGSRPSSVRSPPMVRCPTDPTVRAESRRPRSRRRCVADPDVAEGFAAIDPARWSRPARTIP